MREEELVADGICAFSSVDVCGFSARGMRHQHLHNSVSTWPLVSLSRGPAFLPSLPISVPQRQTDGRREMNQKEQKDLTSLSAVCTSPTSRARSCKAKAFRFPFPSKTQGTPSQRQAPHHSDLLPAAVCGIAHALDADASDLVKPFLHVSLFYRIS